MSVGHLPVAFVIEIFFSLRSLEHGHPGADLLCSWLKVEPGQFPRPHPCLWLLCPSRLRPSWLLAGCLDCWELMCPQHSLEMHSVLTAPELGRLAGYGFGPCQAQRATRAHTWGGRWPIDLPAWDDMLFQRSASAPSSLFFQNTDRSLSRAIEGQARSAPSVQHIQRSFCLHPSLVSVCVPGHPGWPQGPPKCSVCVWALWRVLIPWGCCPLSPPIHPHHPAKLCRYSTFQARGSMVQASFLDSPASCIASPGVTLQSTLLCMYVPCLLPAARVPTSAVGRVPKGQVPASLPSFLLLF